MGGRSADKSAHVYPHTYLEIKNLLCHQSPRISSLPLLLLLNSKKLNVNSHITISWLKNHSLSALVKNVLSCFFLLLTYVQIDFALIFHTLDHLSTHFCLTRPSASSLTVVFPGNTPLPNVSCFHSYHFAADERLAFAVSL